MVKKLLVTGGIRSGKTGLAEQRARSAGTDVVYVATATAGDDEMALRIQRHQHQRPGHWRLVEEPICLGRVLTDFGSLQGPAPLLLVDCMSLWLSNLLFADSVLFQPEREAFLYAVEAYSGPLVIVTNEVGLGTIGMDPLTRRFADELGWLNQALAQRCDEVVMAVAGLPLSLKAGG
ncbi:bifunctional adenosylcobinamide kinase/adenosylcobinamide-phosphate guanylyltransferase [Marinobacter halophilus]|uniref:Bifunctional adenosylcobalamin biosynthesis protein n=1 Tax=Marinobacter halophilus TaxID=1323740 RepID=A0A2T1KJ43_9GAMM|nr:bifunctional adenosylcobinamide kinase/adenosylcobinamide-phosphate guanylyltransferase [Marinobacter halophilus]PSF10164.1 bifunctional adenosylcobinamide kinase/adenosylcobinamide-phosphate guanylyltransferase [Marinobacter halophilus]GGC68298.1 adenosylcobinamide kinase/adenosylcobinamide phosphate guanyltransferase [Marinobacter halophilus]